MSRRSKRPIAVARRVDAEVVLRAAEAGAFEALPDVGPGFGWEESKDRVAAHASALLGREVSWVALSTLLSVVDLAAPTWLFETAYLRDEWALSNDAQVFARRRKAGRL